jgi:GNAT superfamily N-acetyltransferase
MTTEPHLRRPPTTVVDPAVRAADRDPARVLRDLRAVDGADTEQLIVLIGGVFDEYPGCVLDLDDLDADLLDPGAQVARSGGAWWVLPVARDGEDARLMATVGCSAVVPGGTAELKRLYVGAEFRERGLGRALVEHVEAHARAGGASAIELWSDTRFLDAHRLYERLGYTATGQTRDLHDPSNTTEYRFVRELEA